MSYNRNPVGLADAASLRSECAKVIEEKRFTSVRPNAAAFDRLADEWEDGRPRGADIAQMTAHPAYQAIIAMGEPAIPQILDRMATKPDHWFVALHAISGASPVAPENRGRFKAMTADWLKWGQEQGYRD